MSISHISLLPVLPRDRAGSPQSYSHHPRGSWPSIGPQGHALRTACCLSTFPAAQLPAIRAHNGALYSGAPTPSPKDTGHRRWGWGQLPALSVNSQQGAERREVRPSQLETREGFPRDPSGPAPLLRWGPPPVSGSLLCSLGRPVPRSQSDLLTGPQVGGAVHLVGSAPRSQELRAPGQLCNLWGQCRWKRKTLRLNFYLEFQDSDCTSHMPVGWAPSLVVSLRFAVLSWPSVPC